jgi:hypothetical protein
MSDDGIGGGPAALLYRMNPFEKFSNDFIMLSMARCEELDVLRCKASRAARYEADSRDNVI